MISDILIQHSLFTINAQPPQIPISVNIAERAEAVEAQYADLADIQFVGPGRRCIEGRSSPHSAGYVRSSADRRLRGGR